MRSEAIFDVERRRQTLDALKAQRLDPTFWDDPKVAQLVEQEIAAEKDWVEAYDALVRMKEDVETLAEMQAEEDDADLGAEIERETQKLRRAVETLTPICQDTREWNATRSMFFVAMAHAKLGEKAEARDWLRRAQRRLAILDMPFDVLDDDNRVVDDDADREHETE